MRDRIGWLIVEQKHFTSAASCNWTKEKRRAYCWKDEERGRVEVLRTMLWWICGLLLEQTHLNKSLAVSRCLFFVKVCGWCRYTCVLEKSVKVAYKETYQMCYKSSIYLRVHQTLLVIHLFIHLYSTRILVDVALTLLAVVTMTSKWSKMAAFLMGYPWVSKVSSFWRWATWTCKEWSILF